MTDRNQACKVGSAGVYCIRNELSGKPLQRNPKYDEKTRNSPSKVHLSNIHIHSETTLIIFYLQLSLLKLFHIFYLCSSIGVEFPHLLLRQGLDRHYTVWNIFCVNTEP